MSRLQDLLGWFAQNLTVPDRFGSSRAKGAWRRNSDGLSWFKDDASRLIDKAYDLTAILRENGYVVEILTSDRIGIVRFADAHQVVAEPLVDTPS